MRGTCTMLSGDRHSWTILLYCAIYDNTCTGDNDAILVLLLIPRLMAKCELLMTQVRDKVRS